MRCFDIGHDLVFILSLAIILCACDFNYIRRCDSQPICATNRACFSSGDFSLAAFSELFGPGQVCYWKTWFSGSNSPCSSASILDHRLLWSIEFFWVLTRRVWSGWKQALTVVTPDTVVGWHREGVALYGRAISKARGVMGRKRISKEAPRDLIFRMVDENPT